MLSTACWNSEARFPPASPDHKRGRGNCARTPGPCNTGIQAPSRPPAHHHGALGQFGPERAQLEVGDGRNVRGSKPFRLKWGSTPAPLPRKHACRAPHDNVDMITRYKP